MTIENYKRRYLVVGLPRHPPGHGPSLPVSGPAGIAARRNRGKAHLYAIKAAMFAKAQKAHDRRPLPAAVPRLDAVPVVLKKPQKMPHLRRACDDEDDE